MYLEESDGQYTYKGRLDSSGDSVTVTMSSRGTYYHMFIVLIPEAGASVNFSVKHRTTLSSSESSSGLSDGAIAGIIIGSIAFVGLSVGCSVFGKYMRLKRARENNNASNRAIESMNQNANQNNAIIVSSQPQPMIQEPQPMILEPQPVIMQPQPMVMQPQPMVMQPQPMVMQPQPMYDPMYNMYPGQPAAYDPNIGYNSQVPTTSIPPTAPAPAPQSQATKNPSTYYAT